MLGIKRPVKKWSWSACGKHPVARDYFKLSSDNNPVFDALENWLEKGYAALTERGGPDSAVSSWRFWAKGLKKGDLISGIVKDSCDTIGRPYPLLIIGTGKLEGWEKNWESLPFFFEKLWETLEYMSSRRLNELDDFEKAMKSIQAPGNGRTWLNFLKDRFDRNQPALMDEKRARQMAGSLSKDKMALISIDAGQDAYLAQAGGWSNLFKTYGSEVPNAFFIGGAGEKHYLALFRRPIKTEDFIRLWTIPSP